MNVLLAGQKWFGVEVFESLASTPGCDVVCVCAPANDRLSTLSRLSGVAVVESGKLDRFTVPNGVDLIVAAHSHDYISEAARNRSRFGAIGYHPSLLPLHRGKCAIEWAIRMGDRVTGGSVYRLTNGIDCGPVLSREVCFVKAGESAAELWRRAIGPMGVRMLQEAVSAHVNTGFIPGERQDESVSTWEPSTSSPPVHRPDMPQLCAPVEPVYNDCELFA